MFGFGREDGGGGKGGGRIVAASEMLRPSVGHVQQAEGMPRDRNEEWRGDERRIVEKNAFNQVINKMMDWLPKDFVSDQS
jgi:hypothetical protein